MRKLVVFLVAIFVAVGLTHVAPSAVPSCDSAGSRASLAAYMVAFNNGRFVDLDAAFAPSPEFVWYSVAPPKGRSGVGSRNRSTLLTYFRARHKRHEKLSILTFRHVSTQRRDGGFVANFNGDLYRRADDLRPGRRHYKGALKCSEGTQQLIVISIGGPPVSGRPATALAPWILRFVR
jgi:hypothetical protein